MFSTLPHEKNHNYQIIFNTLFVVEIKVRDNLTRKINYITLSDKKNQKKYQNIIKKTRRIMSNNEH